MADTGRPSDYSPELADRICEKISEGISMRAVCRMDDMPSMSTVWKWLRENEVFSQQYARATEERADAMFEEMFEIADDGTNDYVERQNKDGSTYEAFDAEHVQRSKLRVDTRKWAVARMSPRKYGDKLGIEHSGGVAITISPTDADL